MDYELAELGSFYTIGPPPDPLPVEELNPCEEDIPMMRTIYGGPSGWEKRHEPVYVEVTAEDRKYHGLGSEDADRLWRTRQDAQGLTEPLPYCKGCGKQRILAWSYVRTRSDAVFRCVTAR